MIEQGRVHIDEVTTEITLAEGVGPLGPEDVRKIAALVLEAVREQLRHSAQRQRDVEVGDRSFRMGDR